MKLKCDVTLSNFAFNFNLRRYTEVRDRINFLTLRTVRAVQVDSIKTRVETAPAVCNQRLKLKCDEPLSKFAFNVDLRRYRTELEKALAVINVAAVEFKRSKVGRCRLTVSKPELKARLVSALETKM